MVKILFFLIKFRTRKRLIAVYGVHGNENMVLNKHINLRFYFSTLILNLNAKILDRTAK